MSSDIVHTHGDDAEEQSLQVDDDARRVDYCRDTCNSNGPSRTRSSATETKTTTGRVHGPYGADLTVLTSVYICIRVHRMPMGNFFLFPIN